MTPKRNHLERKEARMQAHGKLLGIFLCTSSSQLSSWRNDASSFFALQSLCILSEQSLHNSSGMDYLFGYTLCALLSHRYVNFFSRKSRYSYHHTELNRHKYVICHHWQLGNRPNCTESGLPCLICSVNKYFDCRTETHRRVAFHGRDSSKQDITPEWKSAQHSLQEQ